jgi:hypothetical protein
VCEAVDLHIDFYRTGSGDLLEILCDVDTIAGRTDVLDRFITEDRRDNDLSGLRTPSRRPFVEIQSHAAQRGRGL